MAKRALGPRGFRAWQLFSGDSDLVRGVWVCAMSQTDARKRFRAAGLVNPNVKRDRDYKGPRKVGMMAYGPWRICTLDLASLD